MKKAWNVRDQTKEALESLLEQKYKEINATYKMVCKVPSLKEAQKLINKIWSIKEFTNKIEIELMRREYDNGKTS